MLIKIVGGGPRSLLSSITLTNEGVATETPKSEQVKTRKRFSELTSFH